MLRDMLLSEESDNAELYSAEERQELLYCVFEHLVLGGACCQFEVSSGTRHLWGAALLAALSTAMSAVGTV